MKIALIFNKDRTDTTGCYYEKVFRENKLDFTHFPTECAKKIKPGFDLYLRLDHGDYKYDVPFRLRPAAFLAIDTHLKKPCKKILRQAKHYDFVFAAQKEGALKLSKALRKKVEWIPLACDPEIHKKLDIDKKYDVGFVGSYGGKNSEREKLLLEIKNKFPNSFIGAAPYTQMSEIYSASKIGINCSLNDDVNMRIFEILSCGAMLITSRIKQNGLEELFEEGRHFKAYETAEELTALIEYYLKHDEEREKIALAGYEEAINKHTYKNRLKKIFEVIKQQEPLKFKGLEI